MLNDAAMTKLRELASKSDARLSGRFRYTTSPISDALESLLAGKPVEVGYRSSCGSTDPTMYTQREWQKMLKAVQKAGLRVTEESVNHKNAWATKAGGFWSSSIYSIAA